MVPHYEYHKADSFSRFISPDSFLQGLASAAGVDISNGNSVVFETTLKEATLACGFPELAFGFEPANGQRLRENNPGGRSVRTSRGSGARCSADFAAHDGA